MTKETGGFERVGVDQHRRPPLLGLAVEGEQVARGRRTGPDWGRRSRRRACRGRRARRRRHPSPGGCRCCPGAPGGRPRGRGGRAAPPGEFQLDPVDPRDRRAVGGVHAADQLHRDRRRWSRGRVFGEMPPSRETIRFPSWARSAPAGPVPSASAAADRKGRGRARRGRLISKAVSGELEAAVVEAEGEHDVVGEVAVVDEAGGEPLRLDRVAGAQLGGDLAPGSPPAGSGRRTTSFSLLDVGGGARGCGDLLDRAAEDLRRLGRTCWRRGGCRFFA